MRLRAQSSTVWLVGRGSQPSIVAALAMLCRLRRPSDGVIPRSDGSTNRAAKSGSWRVETFRSGKVLAQDAGHLHHPDELARAEKALARRLRRGHRPDVQIGEVADIDDLQRPGTHPYELSEGEDPDQQLIAALRTGDPDVVAHAVRDHVTNCERFARYIATL
jgi:hypothetical protein